MGDFPGHVYPGTCISLMTLRWIYCVLYRYFLCQREMRLSVDQPRKFESSLLFPTGCLPNFPLEATLWFVLNVGLVIGEIGAMVAYGYSPINSLQHATLMAAFLLPPVVILLRHCKVRLFEGLEYVALMMTLAVTIIIFQHHKHMKSPLENELHGNLSIAFSVTLASVAMEMKCRHVPLAALFRSYSCHVCGCYLIEIGFILYPLQGEPWPSDDHYYKGLATLTFVWQYGLALVMTAFVGLIAKVVVQRKSAMEVIKALDFETGSKRTPANAGKQSPYTDDFAVNLLSSADEEV